jgi:hypothetical protein
MTAMIMITAVPVIRVLNITSRVIIRPKKKKNGMKKKGKGKEWKAAEGGNII